jgi:hypothetical protein
MPWTFEDFVGLPRNNLGSFADWYDEQSDEVKNGVDAVLKNSQSIEDHLQWGAWRRYLKGEAKPHKIWEIGFKEGKRQYRLLGVFRPGKLAILLMGCYHKNSVYTPADAINTAIKRAKALIAGTGTTNARPIPTNY